MNGAEALIFTGGIGENSPQIRRMICERLSWFGVEIDQQINEEITGGREGNVCQDTSRLNIYVIPTNEELLIARDAVRLIDGNGD